MDKEDIKFEQLLKEKHHKELKTILEIIAKKDNNNNNKEILLAIEKQINAIKNLPAPKVIIEQNQVIETLKKIATEKKEWELIVNRDPTTYFIKSLNIKQK